jgi:RecJ-like exonuclease
MRRRTCPKCRGTGNAGYISDYRCDACHARGWFDIGDLQEYNAYLATCDLLGVPVPVEDRDTPHPSDREPDDFDDA